MSLRKFLMVLGEALDHLSLKCPILLSASALDCACQITLASFMINFLKGCRLRPKTRFFIL